MSPVRWSDPSGGGSASSATVPGHGGTGIADVEKGTKSSRPRSGRTRRRGSGTVHMAAFPFPWPALIRCGNCGHPGARIYPFPTFEDRDVFIPAEDLGASGLFDMFDEERTDWDSSEATMGGTIWCPNEDCSPSWGEALLQYMVLASAAIRGVEPTLGEHRKPAIPLLGFLPVEAIAFLESELADFFESPGPLTKLRPHWFGDGPVAARGVEFYLACGQLVTWMREAHITGYLTGSDLTNPALAGAYVLPLEPDVAA